MSFFSHYTNISDLKIWEDFKKGNKCAFEYIYRTYVKDLYNYGMQISRDESIVENSIQETFLDLWRNRQGLGEVEKIKYYLLKALKRKITRSLQSQKKFQFEEDLSAFYEFEFEMPQEFLMISEQLSAERQKRLKQAIQELTPRQREAIYLRFYDGLSYKEISSIMSIHIDTIYNTISKAIESLKRGIQQLGMVLVLFFLI